MFSVFMDQYRVFGNPIAQSKSPFIHQQFATQTEQAINYQSELVKKGHFSEAVTRLINNNGKGANVTAPFKEDAFSICNVLTERAKLAGAVNTLHFIDGKIHGDTTDGLGLVSDLKRHKVALKGANILLLGAGGAAKGVVQSLLEQLPESLTIANRTVSKAEHIVSLYKSCPIGACSFDEANQREFSIIVNATSAGLSGHSLPINDGLLAKASTCYDMVYGVKPTLFLQRATELNVLNVIDGLGMLVGQAAESFHIWCNVMPDVEPVLTKLRSELK